MARLNDSDDDFGDLLSDHTDKPAAVTKYSSKLTANRKLPSIDSDDDFENDDFFAEEKTSEEHRDTSLDDILGIESSMQLHNNNSKNKQRRENILVLKQVAPSSCSIRKDDWEHSEEGHTPGKQSICALCHTDLDKGTYEYIASSDAYIHTWCVPSWRREQILNVQLCEYCSGPLLMDSSHTIVTGHTGSKVKLHTNCVNGYRSRTPFVKPTKRGVAEKYALGQSSVFGKKNFQKRFFVLCPEKHALSYYESEQAFEKNQKPKNTIEIELNTRLCTHPNALVHPACTSSSTNLVLIFTSKEEQRLLLRFQTKDECQSWADALTKYIRIVDFPDDYLNEEEKKHYLHLEQMGQNSSSSFQKSEEAS